MQDPCLSIKQKRDRNIIFFPPVSMQIVINCLQQNKSLWTWFYFMTIWNWDTARCSFHNFLQRKFAFCFYRPRVCRTMQGKKCVPAYHSRRTIKLCVHIHKSDTLGENVQRASTLFFTRGCDASRSALHSFFCERAERSQSAKCVSSFFSAVAEGHTHIRASPLAGWLAPSVFNTLISGVCSGSPWPL